MIDGEYQRKKHCHKIQLVAVQLVLIHTNKIKKERALYLLIFDVKMVIENVVFILAQNDDLKWVVFDDDIPTLKSGVYGV